MASIKQISEFFAEPNFNKQAVQHNRTRILSMPVFDVDTYGNMTVYVERYMHPMNFYNLRDGKPIFIQPSHHDLMNFETLLRFLKSRDLPYALRLQVLRMMSNDEVQLRNFFGPEPGVSEEEVFKKEIELVWWVHAQMFEGYCGFPLFTPFATPEDEEKTYPPTKGKNLIKSDFLRLLRQCLLLRSYCTEIEPTVSKKEEEKK